MFVHPRYTNKKFHAKNRASVIIAFKKRIQMKILNLLFEKNNRKDVEGKICDLKKIIAR